MKKLVSILILISLNVLHSQNLIGKWNGVLKVQGIELRVIFNVNKDKDGFITTMDSPDQGAKNIPITETVINNDEIQFDIPAIQIIFKGKLVGDNIEGNFAQRGITIPLNLSKNEINKEISKRPQEPIAPFDYHTEDITFRNKIDNVSLAGTLSCKLP
jgi:uncharacterized protein